MLRSSRCLACTAALGLALGVLAGPAWADQRGPGGTRTSSELSSVEVAGLLYMREEEKLARDVYLEMYDEWGLVLFDTIAASEQQHTDAVENLLEKYRLADPVADENVRGDFVDDYLVQQYTDFLALGYRSPTYGLMVGAMVEETDIRDIAAQIEMAEHDDIINVYESLICGSRNHLRAFAAALEAVGATYDPIILGDEFWTIAESDVERDCGTVRRRR